MPPNPNPIIISGPSGVGKGTLIHKLITTHPNIFSLTISHTTRAPRANEIHGMDYFFVDDATFNALLSQGEFIEHATFSGHQYGTSRRAIADITDRGLIAVLDIDVQGVRQIKSGSSAVEARCVFIKPPSLEVLEERLRGRGTERDEDVRRRLERARREVEEVVQSEGGLYDRVIVNDDIERAFVELERWVFGRE
ncbi:guanylate kinase [Aspergillus brasiliensis]|uniref:guanylate kinase n=1 Tax=Aspergillus brasiliensis TaxID=319629 RepID=A0A9W6DIH0_9EURO|nr:guanylate kinase [Aspergillus brasiliensis]GKZ43000.1 guanylate kinase [Aspergillus brasiliensis]